ncbi:MAG: cupin domain-containing protein [Chthonomonas sp.]|nr:cupin domain-containing protein [Chthonomonas sp.]
MNSVQRPTNLSQSIQEDTIRRFDPQTFTWENTPTLPYKEDSSPFKAITRQLLFSGGHDLPVELRYFEIGPGGYSTLERHEHAHVVVVARGSGRVLIGSQVCNIDLNDLVQIPPMTWHQFQPAADQTLGILCIVSTNRDRPQRPDEADLTALCDETEVATFIKV